MSASNVLGIDIGTGNVKVLAGAVDDDGQISIIGSGSMPTAGFSKGIVTDLKLLAASVKQAVDCAAVAADIPQESIYLGIGGMDTRFFGDCTGSVAPLSPDGIRPEDITRVDQAAILAHVPDDWQAFHVLPGCYRVNGAAVISPLSCRGVRHLEVQAYIAAVPKAGFQALITALEHTGLQIEGIVSNALVAAQVLLPLTGGQSCLMIDMGAGVTEVVLFLDNRLVPLVSLPVGGEYITMDIMQGLGVSQSHAEAVKRYYSKLDKSLLGTETMLDCNDYGTEDKQISYNFLYRIVESRIEEIVEWVVRAVAPLLPEACVNTLLFTGGCSVMPAIARCLEQKLALPVAVVYPEALAGEYAHPANSACYGLLCYAAGQMPRRSMEGRVSWRSFVKKLKGWVDR